MIDELANVNIIYKKHVISYKKVYLKYLKTIEFILRGLKNIDIHFCLSVCYFNIINLIEIYSSTKYFKPWLYIRP